MLHNIMRTEQLWVPAGIVLQTNPLVIETRNVLETGNTIEYMGRNLQTKGCEVIAMTLEDGTPLERANPGQKIQLETQPKIENVEARSLFRKRQPR